MTEHHFHEYGGTIPDPATFLSVVASRTTRIRLGIAIVVLPLHNPLEVAESYAMVDVISGGRLNFGIGRGTPSSWSTSAIGYEDSVLRLRVRALRSSGRDGLERRQISPASSSTIRASDSCQSRCSNRIRLSGWPPPVAMIPTAGRGSRVFTC